MESKDAKLLMLKAKLAAALFVANDFRENTTIRTIINNYKQRIKEFE